MTGPVLLIHGGFFPEMTAARFWVEPGVESALQDAGLVVVAPDRARQPCSWSDEATYIAKVLGGSGLESCIVIAGSNGCSVGVRLALDHPRMVKALILCWPATAGDAAVDELSAHTLREMTVSDDEITALLDGETLRGVSDRELCHLTVPVVIVPSDPPNPSHETHTVVGLLDLLPHAEQAPGFPETPQPWFPLRRQAFIDELSSIVTHLGHP